MTVEIGGGLFRWWRSGINILPQNKRPTTTAPILHWVTYYCMCCCWSRIFIKAQSIPLWTPWLIGWWVHCLIIALSPQDFLSKYYRRKSGHFTPWGSHIAVLQRGEEEISFFGKKGNWAMITIQKDAPNMPCNTIKRQNTSYYILLHTEAIGQTGPRKLYSLSRMVFFQVHSDHFLAYA